MEVSSRLMTGARPTGGLHMGQYFAAFKPFVESELSIGSFFIVSDLHMLTTKFTVQSTQMLKQSVTGLVAEAIGFGVDPSKTTFYLQSQVPWQARIYSVVQSLAPIDRLLQQISFQEMSRHSSTPGGTSLGLLGYPVLESSDVIMIRASHVTVGESNVGHFDLMRDIVCQLQESYKMSVQMPKVIVGRRNLIGLDGSNKMSKSAGNAVFLRDTNDSIRAKINTMCAIGDKNIVVPNEYLQALGVEEERCNAITQEIQKVNSIPKNTIDEIIERTIDLIAPIREKAEKLLEEPGYIHGLLKEGCIKADAIGESSYSELVKSVSLPRFF